MSTINELPTLSFQAAKERLGKTTAAEHCANFAEKVNAEDCDRSSSANSYSSSTTMDINF